MFYADSEGRSHYITISDSIPTHKYEDEYSFDRTGYLLGINEEIDGPNRVIVVSEESLAVFSKIVEQYNPPFTKSALGVIRKKKISEYTNKL